MKNLALVIGLACFACNPTLNRGDEVTVVELNSSEWRLVWSDEFDGAANSAPDPSKWNYETGGHGFGNAQLEFNTDSTNNARLTGDGLLQITAKREQHLGRQFTSARLNTLGKMERTYGRFDIRARMPKGQGLWPAIWLLAANYETVTWPECGEIDIVEMRGQRTDEVIGSLHGPNYSGGASMSGYLSVSDTLDEQFHTFTVIWTPDSIQWMLDNRLYFERRREDFSNAQPWVFDHPFFLLINLAVGGHFVGDVPNTLTFPKHMLVDYVRIYEKAGAAQ